MEKAATIQGLYSTSCIGFRQPEGAADFTNLFGMARGVQSQDDQKFLADERFGERQCVRDGMRRRVCTRVKIQPADVFDRARAAFLEMFESGSERREAARRPHALRRRKFPLSTRGASQDHFLAAAIGGRIRRCELRGEGREHGVLDLADVLDTFEHGLAVRRGSLTRLFVGKPFRGVSLPKCLQCPSPPFSPETRGKKISGHVGLLVLIMGDGSVGHLQLKKSLEPSLDQQAMETVKTWRFDPTRDPNGVPVSVQSERKVMSTN